MSSAASAEVLAQSPHSRLSECCAKVDFTSCQSSPTLVLLQRCFDILRGHHDLLSRSSHVGQIRLLESAQGGALPLLPTVRAQQCSQVRDATFIQEITMNDTTMWYLATYKDDSIDEFESRSFLLRAYPTMKHHNPHTPIMIREALGIEPKMWTRYGQ